jgi:hypothetical protein
MFCCHLLEKQGYILTAMRRFRRLRSLASLVALLLLAATTAYAVHHHEEADKPASAEHCDLCLQLGATAGAPTGLAPVAISDAPGYQLPAAVEGVVPRRHFLQPLQARAPPRPSQR